jgi:hypothetical protein
MSDELAGDELAAVILVPDAEQDRWLTRCMHHIEQCGYRLEAIVQRWEDAHQLVGAGQVQVVVVARPEHLPPQRVPRFEVAGEVGPAPTPRQRRPRLIPRDAAP